MPFQRSNVGGIPLLKSPWDMDFAKILEKGMQLRHEPQRLMRAKQQEELANVLSREKGLQAQAETPYAAQNAQSNAAIQANTAKYGPALSEAEIRQKELLAKYGGVIPSGETGELLAAHNLNASGHPIGPQALENLKAKLKLRQQNYDLSPKRASTELGKYEFEKEALDAKMNAQGATPEQIAKAQRGVRAIQLAELQKTGDAATRDLVDKGNNIKKTLHNLDFDALSKGVGVSGKKWVKMQELKALKGNESPEYHKYLAANTAMGLLTKQVGQFYGTPAAIEAQDKLAKLVYDPRWLTNPAAVKAEFNMLKNLLEQEHDTYEDRLLYKASEIQKVTGRANNRENPTPNYEGKTRNLDLTTRKLS